MQETFPFLGLTVHAYGLCLALGAFLLLILMGLLGYGYRLPPGTVRVFGAVGIPLGLLCSRLVFCLLNLSLFTETYENPWLMLRFFDGGLSMTGFLLGLLLAAFLAARLMKARFGKLVDALAAPLALFMALARFGERYTSLGVGKVVEEGVLTKAAPWLFLTETMGIATEYRMAVSLYEALAALVIFLLILAMTLHLRKNKDVRDGDVALIFFSLYGASQLVLESLRDDGHLMITFLRVAQVAAALMPVWATAVFTKRYVRIWGKADGRIVRSWLLVLLCLAGGIALEFSLDGRLSWGAPSMLRDYLLLSGLALVLFWVPFRLFLTLCRKVYPQGHILVHVDPKP